MSPLRAVVPQSPVVRLVTIVVAACVISSVASGVISGLIIRSSIDASNAQQAAKLRAAQVAGCQRQNLRTEIANTNALDTWRFDSLFASALTRPSSQPQTAEQKRLLLTFRSRLRDTVASLTWTPIIPNCVLHPTSVQLPTSFADRQPASSQLVRPK